MPAKRRRADRAPRTGRRSRPLALLILGPLLCAVALTALGYVGLRQQAQTDTQAQVGVAAQAARGALLANMGTLAVTNGQITSALPANVGSLNNNSTEAQRLRAQVGVDILFAQREQGSLIVIASSLAPPQRGGAPAGLAERLGGPLAANSCAAPATGALTLAGIDYLAGSAPLVDGVGNCVGAVVALRPVSALALAPLEYAVVLAMAGALLTLLTAAIGLALVGRADAAADAAQAERVRMALEALDDAQSACAAQMAQREWISRRLAAGERRMRQVITGLAVDRVALQETTSEVWAGVSQPGAPISPAAAVRLARENAVVAARVGSHLNDFDRVTDTLFADLEVATEVDALLDDALARMASAISATRSAISGEPEPAEPVQVSRPTPEEDLFATNILDAQYRESGAPPVWAPDPAPPQTDAFTGPQRAQTSEEVARRQRLDNLNASASHSQPGMSNPSGRRHAIERDQPPRPQRPAPRPRPDQPPDGRDRDSSGSRWLND
ncbi:MAG: hypothetical protein KGO05_13805 [Chloroflexota bacterium]|nr:hypothetical protein [Chloroflexota bacterium]